MKKEVTIKYFALLKEQANKDAETLQTLASTAQDLFIELSKQYPFSLTSEQVRVAINEEFKPMNTPLMPGDCVVFIPPVAGG